MSEIVKHITDASFEADVLKNNKPVLVDFWAEWCGPCKMISPMVDDLANDYVGRVVFTKMNIDQNDQTPAFFGLRSIPTLLLFKNGQVVAQHVGALSKMNLKAFIDKNI